MATNRAASFTPDQARRVGRVVTNYEQINDLTVSVGPNQFNDPRQYWLKVKSKEASSYNASAWIYTCDLYIGMGATTPKVVDVKAINSVEYRNTSNTISVPNDTWLKPLEIMAGLGGDLFAVLHVFSFGGGGGDSGSNGTVTGQVWQTVSENLNAHQFPVAHAIT